MVNAVQKLDPPIKAMLAEDIPVQLSEFRSAMGVKNLSGAADVVHSIRGSAAFCRLDSLCESARLLENALKSGEPTSAVIESFERNVEQLLRELGITVEHK